MRRVALNTIEVNIETGAQDPNKDTRIFLGFKINNVPVPGIRAREFRLRQGNDANPFRSNTTKNLIFGTGANVENQSLNDPRNPQIDEANIIGAYIRVSPELKESWDIKKTTTFVKLTPGGKTFTLGGDITLQEDAGEEVQF
jgi:hypothetical protein